MCSVERITKEHQLFYISFFVLKFWRAVWLSGGTFIGMVVITVFMGYMEWI